jgi:hypothetical protein
MTPEQRSALAQALWGRMVLDDAILARFPAGPEEMRKTWREMLTAPPEADLEGGDP